MAMSNQRIGELVGYNVGNWTDKSTGEYITEHRYLVLVKQRPDPKTNLPQECAVYEVKERKEILGVNLKFGQKVSFWEEERRRSKEQGGGTYMMCCGLEKL